MDPERFENCGIILISHNTAGVQLILLVVKKFKQVDPTNSSGCSSVLFGLGHIPLRLCHTVLCSKMGEIEELLSSLLREQDSISSATMCQSPETDSQPASRWTVCPETCWPQLAFHCSRKPHCLAEESAASSPLSFPSSPKEVQMQFGLQPVLEHLCSQGYFLGLMPQRPRLLLPSNP